ncbi:hypothetical protein GCM10010116_32280 [Microbispora rosea subsp. aerata]|nr:hypothetical protein GCM10010116_32280 [Microbispora rosea subsp. aerata]GIH55832.1 hypothetical protein Mro02_27460 [Microbispora rosea subsp. aerata]GLJ83254.1 hypothetical protein GCM10017588_19810 [Microbispora rosea subsp. aerata]
MLSSWALETFGPRAGQIRQGVVDALTLALENAQDAQKTAQTEHLHPFGFTLMSRKFEALARTFADMPDVATVKPPGSQHELVVLGGNLLFPFRYAKDRSVDVRNARIGDGRPSGLVQALFTRFGPQPWAEQLTLGVDVAPPEPTPAARALTRLPEGTRLVLIAYACNAQAGLLDVWWGEAELLDHTGSLRWHHCEPIPLAGQSPAAGLPGVAAPVGEASPFARGAMPAPALNPRPPYERATALPPMSEMPYAPNAAADEGR